MATKRWQGGAAAVAQITTLTPGGTIEISDLFKVTINGKVVSYAATDTTVASVCTGLAAALEASEEPEFTEIDWADSVTCVTATAGTAGVPFTLSVETTESDSSAADTQTFSASTTTSSSGPNHWDTALNWSGGSVPTGGTNEVQTLTGGGTISGGTFTITFGGQTTSAIAWDAVAATVQAALEALSTISTGNISVTGGPIASAPFSLTFQNALGYQNVAQITASAASLTGSTPTLTPATSTPGVTGDDVYLEHSSVDILYGLSQASVALNLLEVAMSFTGKIGLKLHNGSYYEYRDTFLAIGATTLNLGTGTGTGSGRVRINLGTIKSTINGFDSGTPEESGLEAVLLKGTNAYNTANLIRGSYCFAPFASDQAVLQTLRIGYKTNRDNDATVRIREGATLTTLTKVGGDLDLSAGFTTGEQTSGTTVFRAGAAGTLTVRGGQFVYSSTGTLTTGKVADTGWLDFSQDPRPKTVTNPIEIYGDESRFSDPHGVVNSGVYSLDLNECQDLSRLDLPPNKRLTLAATA